MKVKEFTITKYRSIIEAYKISLDPNMTILIGKNNEGKSNILKALQGAFLIMDALKDSDIEMVKRLFLKSNCGTPLKDKNDWYYDWDRDFPVSLQRRCTKNIQTTFRLVFLLTDVEREEFAQIIGHSFNEELPFEIILSKDDIEIDIPKRAFGGTNKFFKSKYNEIAKFIIERLDGIYIPAVRPADTSIDVVEKLIDRELRIIAKTNPEYKKAQIILNNAIQETVSNLKYKIEDNLKGFIPTIKNIEIDYIGGIRRYTRRGLTEIKIDDGVKTSIREKGDGLQSLVTLALMQSSDNSNKALTIAIEEPESHLHPEAVRRIKNILNTVSDKNQIIISTHSPIFVNTNNLSANIIVRNNGAQHIENIAQIRKELGVAVSDNLIDAEYILLVEGGSDVKVLSAILKNSSDIIKKALDDGILSIVQMGGANNLKNQYFIYKGFLCKEIMFYLDNDSAANNAKDNLKKDEPINLKNFIQSTVLNKKESELEDILDIDFYKEFIPTTLPDWKKYICNNKKKWSENIKDLYLASGYNDLDLDSLKHLIANKVVKDPSNAVSDKARITSVDSLKGLLESYLKP